MFILNYLVNLVKHADDKRENDPQHRTHFKFNRRKTNEKKQQQYNTKTQ